MFNFIFSSIRNKLLAITGFGTALVLAASVFGLWQGWQAILSYERLIAGDVRLQEQASALMLQTPEPSREGTTMLLRGADEADHARHWEAVNALQEDILRNAAALISAVRQNDVRELLQRFQTAQERAIGALREARQYYLQFQSAETADAMVMTVLEQNANLLQQAVDLLGAHTARESNLVAESARRLMTLSVAALVVSVLLAFALF